MNRLRGTLRDGAVILAVGVSLAWSALRWNAPQPEVVPEAARYRVSPIMLPGSGPDTVVVWFDYECQYCRKLEAQIDSVLGEDAMAPTFAFRPVLTSDRSYGKFAFGLAICAANAHDGVETHRRLVDSTIAVATDTTSDPAYHLARAVADPALTDSLFRCAKSPAISRQIFSMAREADRLELASTPALVVGDRLFMGTPNSTNDLRAILARR